MVIDVPMAVIKDEQKMFAAMWSHSAVWVHPLLSFLSGPGAQLLVVKVHPLQMLSSKVVWKIYWLLLLCVMQVFAFLPVCINAFVCDGNESGTENWSLQNSLLFNEPCQTKLGPKILLTWVETLKPIMGARVALFVTDITVAFSTSTSIYCSFS